MFVRRGSSCAEHQDASPVFESRLTMATYYELLGVNPHSSDQEIHDGFANALHDFQKSLSHPIHADQTKIGLLRSAYETLIDPSTRAAYDRSIGMPLPHLSNDAEKPLPGEQKPTMADTLKNSKIGQLSGIGVWLGILAAESSNTKKDITGGVIFMILGIPLLLVGTATVLLSFSDLFLMHQARALTDIELGVIGGGLFLLLGNFTVRLALTKFTGRNHSMKIWNMGYAIFQESAVPKSASEDPPSKDSNQRQFISTQGRIGHVVAALGLLAYGAFGLHQNDIYIPGKHSNGIHFHGTTAWVMYGAFIFASLNLLSVAADHFDSSAVERDYHIFAKVTQVAGWTLFVGALVMSIFTHSQQW